MPKKRLPGSKSGSRHVTSEVTHWLRRSLKVHRFLGLSLAGGKTDKTCLAVVEYYPEQGKIFLSHLEDRLQTQGEISADEVLVDVLKRYEKRAEMIAIDVPLKLPKCMRCHLVCPGYEKCDEPEIQWLWDEYRQRNQVKRPSKLFTPYTERCAETYIAHQLEEKFDPPHALGANMAPLTARAHYIFRRFKIPKVEVYPRLSLWRIGRSLGIQKSYLRTHKHSFGGKEARSAIIQQLVARDIAFLYEQDQRALIERPQPFDAFLCALTSVLKFKGQVEKRPPGFPRGEAWIEVPRMDIRWP